jgi:hypothetical protein
VSHLVTSDEGTLQLDDATMTSLRRLRRGVRRPPGDEAVRPLPGGASTRCVTSAAYNAQVSYHLPVIIIFFITNSQLPIILCFIYGSWTRKGVAAVTLFVGRLQPYVDELVSAAHEENVVTEHCLHDGVAWVAYL